MGKKDLLYPNLVAELARLNIDKKELAAVIDSTEITLYRKLNGNIGEFSISECLMIKAFLERKASRKYTLEYLFNISIDELKE